VQLGLDILAGKVFVQGIGIRCRNPFAPQVLYRIVFEGFGHSQGNTAFGEIELFHNLNLPLVLFNQQILPDNGDVNHSIEQILRNVAVAEIKDLHRKVPYGRLELIQSVADGYPTLFQYPKGIFIEPP
jgi:hypothetical protein